MSASLLSINVGRARAVPWGQLKRSAIDKRAHQGMLFVSPSGVDTDERADPIHCTPDQAVYAFAREELTSWEAQLGRPLPNGLFGENLTTLGLDVDGAVIGERWQVGGLLLLEVSSPRIPCAVFSGFIGEEHWAKRFTERGRPGAYLRVIRPGLIQAGDSINILERPLHGLTVEDVFRARTGARELWPRLLEAPALSTLLRDWVEHRLSTRD
jgi:MOSC domain-containing protein YiiM